jgi:ABC-type antimicrobial peptide transport system ATPase subunit
MRAFNEKCREAQHVDVILNANQSMEKTQRNKETNSTEHCVSLPWEVLDVDAHSNAQEKKHFPWMIHVLNMSH